MKDILLSGITYKSVEQIHFDTPSGKRATFVDADTKKPQEIMCTVSCKFGNKVPFAINTTLQTITPKTTIFYILEE